MSTNGAYGKLHVALEDVMVDAALVHAARARVYKEARDPDDAAELLAMLGIGAEPAWNMGAA